MDQSPGTTTVELYGKAIQVFSEERRGALLVRNQQGLQPHLVKVLQQLIQAKSFDYFLDVGANYGEFSCALGARVPEHILFEPHPELASLLTMNFAKDNYVSIENVAISDHEGTDQLHFRDGYLGASSLSPVYLESLPAEQWGFRSSTRTVGVVTRTLDSYRDQIRSSSGLLIKVDVEGYEAQVIRGMKELLQTAAHWTMLLEFNPITLNLLQSNGAWGLWNQLPSRRGIIIKGGRGPKGRVQDWEQARLPADLSKKNCDLLMFGPN